MSFNFDFGFSKSKLNFSLKGLLISVFVISMTIQSSFAYVTCPDGSACADRKICCVRGSGYSCCPDNYYCCRDGDYCCMRNNKSFLPIISPSLPIEENQNLSYLSDLTNFGEMGKIDILGILSDSVHFLDNFLSSSEFYVHAPHAYQCKSDVKKTIVKVINTIDLIINSTLIHENIEEFLIEVSKNLSQIFLNLGEAIENCADSPEDVRNIYAHIVTSVKSEGFLTQVSENIKAHYEEIKIHFHNLESDCNGQTIPKCGETLGLLFGEIFVN